MVRETIRRSRELLESLVFGPDDSTARMVRWAVITLAAAAAYLFWGLPTPTLWPWDESRLAVNAIEMHARGLGLVTTYGFRPDLWNTKPPLLIWLMWGSMRLFGPHEWALRLPSIIASLGVLGLVLGFTWRVSRSVLASVSAALMLEFSFGFSGWHAALTGDYDATLVFWVTAYACVLFSALRRRRPPTRLLLLAGALIAAAVLTKGVAGLIPGVGVAIWLTIARRWRRIRDWRWVAAAAMAAAPIAAFYLAREAASPGYLTAMWGNEIGRYAQGLCGHDRPFVYYLEHILLHLDFAPGLAVLWLLAGLRFVRGRARAGAVFSLCLSIAVLAVFSLARTKLRWYVEPAYPFLAVACGLGLRAWASRLDKPLLGAVAAGLAAVALAAFGVAWKAADVRHANAPGLRPYGQVFAELQAHGVRRAQVIDTGLDQAPGLPDYAPQLQFYAVRAAEQGLAVAQVTDWPQLDRGAGVVLVSCDDMWTPYLRAAGPALAEVSGCVAVESRGLAAASPISPAEVAAERQQRSGAGRCWADVARKS